MNGQIDIGGVFIHPLLIAAVLAYLLLRPIEWALDRIGFYRLIWHRGLFDLSLTLIVWGLIAAALADNFSILHLGHGF